MFAADTQADQDALHGDVGAGAGKGLGGHLPVAAAQPVGRVEQGIAGVLALRGPPGDETKHPMALAEAENREYEQQYQMTRMLVANARAEAQL
jgi:hypothetical protein